MPQILGRGPLMFDFRTEGEVEELRGKRVVVLGLARQGLALTRFLVRKGAQVTVSDAKPAEVLQPALETLAGLPVRYVLGSHPESLLESCDLLCLSGGVSVDLPLVHKARQLGIPLSNDSQLFLERCPAMTLGITGSAGKTTTTTLVGEMCKMAGFRTWVGGNIGNPLIADLDLIGPGDRAIMELSSFQLEIMSASPRVAAILNVTPNHLDRHPSMEAYTAAKAQILRAQHFDDVAVLGWDNPITRGLASQVHGRLYWFSGQDEVQSGACLVGNRLIARPDDDKPSEVCRVDEIRLLGRHNVLNMLAACAIASAARVPVQAMRQVATTFAGVPHRLEFVRELRGVRYYDDSIATSPERVVAALESFEAPIILLAGGRDKKLPWEEMAALTRRKVRHLVLFGECADLIAGAVKAAAPTHKQGAGIEGSRSGEMFAGIHRAADLADAIEIASHLAQRGDIVLLSPGATSFDAFRDFAERGDRFKEEVNRLR